MNLLRRAQKNKQLVSGSILASIILLLGIIGPFVLGDYSDQDLLLGHLPPKTSGFLLGSDALGRDIAARAVVGIRISLIVAISVTVIAVIAGTAIGLIAGYVKGAVDSIISLIVDFIWGFPLILVAVLAAASIGSGLLPVILAVGLVNTVAIARVVRGEVLGLSEKEFIVAAKAGGYSTIRILTRHLLPNIIPVVLVPTTSPWALSQKPRCRLLDWAHNRHCRVSARWFPKVATTCVSITGNPQFLALLFSSWCSA